VNNGCRYGNGGLQACVQDGPTMLAAVRNDRLLVALAVLVGVALIVIAVVYWAEPAKSLPGFFPGHEAGSSHHHTKHGIAAFLVGLACLAFAWFRTGPQARTRS
jgi:hypothetical protein